jgi:hypothetical protein
LTGNQGALKLTFFGRALPSTGPPNKRVREWQIKLYGLA